MKFSKLFSVVCEGGGAVRGVTRIAAADIDPTFHDFKRRILDRIGLPADDESLIGSSHAGARFKETFGDIDVVVDMKDCGGAEDPKEAIAWLAGEVTRATHPSTRPTRRSRPTSDSRPSPSRGLLPAGGGSSYRSTSWWQSSPTT